MSLTYHTSPFHTRPYFTFSYHILPCRTTYLTLAPRVEALNSKFSSPCQECIYVDNTVCELQWRIQGVVFCDMWKLVVGLSTQGGEEQGEEHIRSILSRVR